jgi:hypothetical protein
MGRYDSKSTAEFADRDWLKKKLSYNELKKEAPLDHAMGNDVRVRRTDRRGLL